MHKEHNMTTNHGQFEIVNVADLSIDQRVQQNLRPAKVSKIIKDGFDLSLAGTITVSRRKNGALIVLDGQHRAAAAREVGVEKLPAIVHDGLTLEEEARHFLGLNNKSNPTAVAKFLVSCVQGDEDSNDIKSIIEDRGWRVSEGNGRDGRCFKAVTRAKDIYDCRTKYFEDSDIYGDELLGMTMEVITDAWGTVDSRAVNANTLGGIALLLKKYWAEVDTDRLSKALSEMSPAAFMAATKGAQESMDLKALEAAGFAAHRAYNSARRGRNKLDTWFL